MDYRLPDDEFRSIFHEAIEKQFLANSVRADKPKAVFFGGQPGCGKSTMVARDAGLFGDEGVVVVDIDRVRDLHPAYLSLVMDPEMEALAPGLVQTDCSVWMDMLVESAVADKRNLLIDKTLWNPSQIRRLAPMLQEAGYEVEVKMLAVHEKSSEVSLRIRFEHEKQKIGFGRTIPDVVHDRSASGVIETLRAVETEGLADCVRVIDRGGQTIYENQMVNGIWEKVCTGPEVMGTFRDRSLDCAEKVRIAGLWDSVLDMMTARGATETEMAPFAGKRDRALRDCEIEGAVETGFYSGRVVKIADGALWQKIGRLDSDVVVHRLAMLDSILEKEDMADIRYGKDGVGVCMVIREQAVELG